MFGKKPRREAGPAQRAESSRAASVPSSTGLSGDTKIKDWLAHPQGGPVLRELLAQGGADESQLSPVRGFAMKRLIPMSKGQFTEEIIAQLVVKAENYEPSGVDGATEGRFAGRTVVVTGAGSGIGRDTASHVAHEGGRVIAVDKDKSRLEELANELRGFDVVTVVAGITVHADADAVTDLLSDESQGANGAILPSDGGWSAV